MDKLLEKLLDDSKEIPINELGVGKVFKAAKAAALPVAAAGAIGLGAVQGIRTKPPQRAPERPVATRTVTAPSPAQKAAEWNKSWRAERIRGKRIFIGEDAEEVEQDWGKPNDINRTTGSWGVHEQWVYEEDYKDDVYIYFEDGIVTSWQD